MMNGLGFSRYIGGRSAQLGGIYARAYNDLIRQMQDSAATLWQEDRARAMLARVQTVVTSLDAETKKFMDAQVPAVYYTLGKEAKKDIVALNVAVPPQFGQVHTAAVNAIADDAMLKFGHTMTGITRSAEEFVQLAKQRAIREQIASGMIKGQAAEELAKEVKGMIEEQGITALIDKGGKHWQLDTYAEMLTRQVLGNSGRMGTSNTAQEYGFDLVQITDHGTDHEECAEWEGKIVSLTGRTKGYPTIDQAEASGLFHVNCKHGYFIVSGKGETGTEAFSEAELTVRDQAAKYDSFDQFAEAVKGGAVLDVPMREIMPDELFDKVVNDPKARAHFLKLYPPPAQGFEAKPISLMLPGGKGGDKFFVEDGLHRFAAALREGKTSIQATIYRPDEKALSKLYGKA